MSGFLMDGLEMAFPLITMEHDVQSRDRKFVHLENKPAVIKRGVKPCPEGCGFLLRRYEDVRSACPGGRIRRSIHQDAQQVAAVPPDVP